MIPPRRPQGPPPPPPPTTKPNSPEFIKVNTKVASANQTGNNNFSPNPKSAKSKSLLIIIAIVILALASVAGAFFLLQERQDIRKGATSICPPGDNGQAGQNCSNLNKCDVAGGCNSACCASNSDCPSGQTCTIPNGYCRSGKSCNDSGTTEYHKECRNNQCVEVAGSGSDQCSSHDQCRISTPPPGKTYTSCASWGYQNDPGCTADPNCTAPGQDGFCCINSQGVAACCYRNGECYEGQQGNCENLGNGKIWLAGGLQVEIYKMTGANVSCPYSSSQRTAVFSGITQSGGQEFSLGSNECGQIEAIGYCGSCRPGCTPTQPTESPPTLTPTPTPTPEPTPTPPQYSCNCHTIKVYDQNKNLLAYNQLENLKAGDLIYIGVVANNGYPSYPVDKARIRVNRNSWLEQDETSEKINHDYPAHLTEFIKPYTVPEGVLNFKIEAEVYLDGPSGIGGWF